MRSSPATWTGPSQTALPGAPVTSGLPVRRRRWPTHCRSAARESTMHPATADAGRPPLRLPGGKRPRPMVGSTSPATTHGACASVLRGEAGQSSSRRGNHRATRLVIRVSAIHNCCNSLVVQWWVSQAHDIWAKTERCNTPILAPKPPGTSRRRFRLWNALHAARNTQHNSGTASPLGWIGPPRASCSSVLAARRGMQGCAIRFDRLS